MPALVADPQKASAQLNDSVRFDSVELRGLKADVPGAPLVTLESLESSNKYGSGGAITAHRRHARARHRHHGPRHQASGATHAADVRHGGFRH
ncbi:MAG: hypothetical protein WDN04_23275 [Rhodospirillales bacterium]